jgi:capsular polysaccharide export protein
MQVTADSQILLNSDVSLLDALAIAMRKSIEDGVTLIIKPHPAELDKTIYTRIQKQYPQAVIMNGDTREMIRKADKIITINSTVGLESILLGKQVEFLGKSFYQYLTQKEEWIPKYIMGYLVNIDYFGTSDITENVLEECLKR